MYEIYVTFVYWILVSNKEWEYQNTMVFIREKQWKTTEKEYISIYRVLYKESVRNTGFELATRNPDVPSENSGLFSLVTRVPYGSTPTCAKDLAPHHHGNRPNESHSME